MTFDWTIRLSDVIASVIFVGGIPLVHRLYIAIRDIRDLIRAVGSEGPPPTGLIADVQGIRRETLRHRDWLIEMNAGLPPESKIRMERS